MNNTLVQKVDSASRQFSPLILYHKHGSLDHQSPQNKKQCQPHSINMETRICQHLAKTNDMLERNAQLWAIQECTSHATLSDETAPHKKGFVNVVLANETITDQNENDLNDIIPSSSSSSTFSNSSTNSNDSTATTIATPICPTKSIPMSALVITPPPSSPTTIPLEPKTDNRPPPPLCQPTIYTMPNFYRHHADDHYFHRSHHHPNQPPLSSSPAHAAMPVSPSQYYSDDSTTAPAGFIASFTSSPHDARSKWMNDEHGYDNKHHRRAAECSPSPTHTHRKKNMTGAGMKKRRRGNLPKHVTEFLKRWLLQHKEHPYPTERQKLELAQRTDLAVNQISNWFINARRRILHPMLETEQQQLRHQQHQYLCMDAPLHHHQPRYYPSPAAAFSTTSASAASASTLLPKEEEEEERRQHPWVSYVTHGYKGSVHDNHHWSIHRTKLPTIEIPGKDQHLFATVS